MLFLVLNFDIYHPQEFISEVLPNGLENIFDDDRLEHVQFEMSVRSTNSNRYLE